MRTLKWLYNFTTLLQLELYVPVYIHYTPVAGFRTAGTHQTIDNLKGNIGSFPVAMHLHKAGHYYSGYYYYTKTEQPVYITGNDTAAGNGKIWLMVFEPGEYDNEIFTLAFKEDGYTREWQKAG